MMDSDVSYTNQNNGPRRPHLSSTAFSKLAVGTPEYGYWRVHGLSRAAGSPANGTTRSSSTTPRVQQHRVLLRHTGNDPVWNYDSTGPTPITTSNAVGTGTLSSQMSRTQHRLREHHCSGRHQGHPGGQHGDARHPLHRWSGAHHRHPAPPGAAPLGLRLLRIGPRQHQHHHQPQVQHRTPSTTTPHPGCNREGQPR